MHSTPISLIDRLREPTGNAWEEFVRLYTPLLYLWANRAGLQDADAADLVQEVLVLLLAKLPSFRHERPGSFRAWLRTVTLNKWRERQRRAAVPVVGNTEALDAIAQPDSVRDFWETDYRRHLVRQAMTLMQVEFQPTTWKACWEHVVNDKPAVQVGAELGLSAGAVRAATFRVLHRLRRDLKELLD